MYFAASTGYGLATPGALGSIPGWNAAERIARTMTPADVHATTRQRGDSSRPSGKSRSRNVPTLPMAGIQIQSPSQVAKSAPGSGADPVSPP